MFQFNLLDGAHYLKQTAFTSKEELFLKIVPRSVDPIKLELVSVNEVDAVKWYRMAADQGNATAQYNVGVRHKNGRGIERNEVEAVKWYRMAADQRNVNAQYNV